MICEVSLYVDVNVPATSNPQYLAVVLAGPTPPIIVSPPLLAVKTLAIDTEVPYVGVVTLREARQTTVSPAEIETLSVLFVHEVLDVIVQVNAVSTPFLRRVKVKSPGEDDVSKTTYILSITPFIAMGE